MNYKHLFWIVPLALLVGIAIGYYLGIYQFVMSAMEHLDLVKSIQIQFNETAMVEAVAKYQGVKPLIP